MHGYTIAERIELRGGGELWSNRISRATPRRLDQPRVTPYVGGVRRARAIAWAIRSPQAGDA
jgi:hypothetical protein